jgi:hypothetical protein
LTDWLTSFWFLPFLLYAETHYRFRHLPSLLRKHEPEVIADAPFRLEPGARLPVLILVKDAHLFPCTIQQVSCEIRQGNKRLHSVEYLSKPVFFNEKLSSLVFWLDAATWEGWIELNVILTIEQGGKTTNYHNDNHRTSSHRPLKVFIAKEPLPRFANLYLGDPHIHSAHTDDQVEFGAPLLEARELARSMGLSFYCVTDHSYDLDDRLDSFLRNDPDLPKWQTLQAQIDTLNRDDSTFAVVRGEEVSCRNADGKNVHLLLLGQREYVHGSGDSAERWFRTRSEHSTTDVLSRCSEGAVTFAAHARERVPFLQRILLGRAMWSERDLLHPNLSGIQIFNGRFDLGAREGYKSWITQLLSGRRFSGIAGNDAHGNFNRFRQIGAPFLLIREESYHLFGKMRTGVFIEDVLTEDNILRALQHCGSIMSDGPVARIVASQDMSHPIQVKGSSGVIDFEVEALSSSEFGALSSIRVLTGRYGEKSERTAFDFDGAGTYVFCQHISLKRSSADYVRVEANTLDENDFDRQPHFCFTNPIWFSDCT